MTDFDDGNSKFGLKISHFTHLSDDDKKDLVTLMSRIMEKAYRRGVQQVLYLATKGTIEESILDDLNTYRYRKSLDQSPGLDGFLTSSKERLLIEEHLEILGFFDE